MAFTNKDIKTIAGMVARDDKDHNIAAWFGENQGRVAEAKNGEYGPFVTDPSEKLPPKGPPGVKGRRLRGWVNKAITALEEGNPEDALEHLKNGLDKYNSPED